MSIESVRISAVNGYVRIDPVYSDGHPVPSALAFAVLDGDGRQARLNAVRRIEVLEGGVVTDSGTYGHLLTGGSGGIELAFLTGDAERLAIVVVLPDGRRVESEPFTPLMRLERRELSSMQPLVVDVSGEPRATRRRAPSPAVVFLRRWYLRLRGPRR